MESISYTRFSDWYVPLSSSSWSKIPSPSLSELKGFKLNLNSSISVSSSSSELLSGSSGSASRESITPSLSESFVLEKKGISR